MTNRCIKAPPSGELSPQVTERVHPAVPLCGSTRENVVPKSPQTFRYHKIKIILLRFSTKISEDVERRLVILNAKEQIPRRMTGTRSIAFIFFTINRAKTQ